LHDALLRREEEELMERDDEDLERRESTTSIFLFLSSYLPIFFSSYAGLPAEINRMRE